jgi:hypothetical protein
MVAAAAGPWWLCCCAPGRVVKLFALLKPAASRDTEAPQCCCHHDKATPKKSAPDKSSMPRLPCECKDTQPTPLIQTGSELDELAQLGKSLASAGGACEAAPMKLAPEGVDTTQLIVFLGLGGRDLLALNHILRC